MKTAMQELIVHLEMLKSRVDMADINSLIEYATTSLEKEREQLLNAFRDNSWDKSFNKYYNETYNQNK